MKGLWNLYTTTTTEAGIGLIAWNLMVLIVISGFTGFAFVAKRIEWPEFRTLLAGFVALIM